GWHDEPWWQRDDQRHADLRRQRDAHGRGDRGFDGQPGDQLQRHGGRCAGADGEHHWSDDLRRHCGRFDAVELAYNRHWWYFVIGGREYQRCDYVQRQHDTVRHIQRRGLHGRGHDDACK